MKTKSIISLVLILAIILLTGCSGNNAGGVPPSTVIEKNGPIDALAIVASASKNSPQPDISSCANVVKSACLSAADVYFIEADGRPYVAETTTIPESKKGVAEDKLQSDAALMSNEIINYTKTLTPISEEVDLLKAIILGSKMLGNNTGSKAMIINASGLCTTGVLDMNTSLLTLDTGVIIDYLEKQACIPDLSGVEVYFIGLGETVDNQSPPSELDYRKLKEIYTNLIEAGGGNVEFLTLGTYSESNTYSGFPHVSEVVFPSTSVLTESEVQFIVGTANFVNPQEAEAAISEAAAEYNVGTELVVVGLASSEGEAAANKALSKKRADKVADILNAQGLKATGVGLGYNQQYCVDDTHDGKLDENLAAKNRKCIIITAASAAGKEALNTHM